MAVFTPVSFDEAAAFLEAYSLGPLEKLEPIAQGVENSNFFLHTPAGRFVLTLFERRVSAKELPFFVALMRYLSRHGVVCPHPVAAHDGTMLGQLNQRPALIVTCLEGMERSFAEISAKDCHALGRAVAQMHQTSLAMGDGAVPFIPANALSLDGWQALARKITPELGRLGEQMATQLVQELEWLKTHWPQQATRAVIHADLFPDNVFFAGKNPEVSGIIDWYFACEDALLYEVAIILNAWCMDDQGAWMNERAQALMAGYRELMPLTDEEWKALPIYCRGAAVRFFLTRAHDWLFHDPNALVTPKDPMAYWRRMETHINVSHQIP